MAGRDERTCGASGPEFGGPEDCVKICRFRKMKVKAGLVGLSAERQHSAAAEPDGGRVAAPTSPLPSWGTGRSTSPLSGLGFLTHKMGIILPCLLPQTATGSREVMFLKMCPTVKAHTLASVLLGVRGTSRGSQ